MTAHDATSLSRRTVLSGLAGATAVGTFGTGTVTGRRAQYNVVQGDRCLAVVPLSGDRSVEELYDLHIPDLSTGDNGATDGRDLFGTGPVWSVDSPDRGDDEDHGSRDDERNEGKDDAEDERQENEADDRIDDEDEKGKRSQQDEQKNEAGNRNETGRGNGKHGPKDGREGNRGGTGRSGKGGPPADGDPGRGRSGDD